MIYFADLFYINIYLDFASYADDTTPYFCRDNFLKAIDFLRPNIEKVFSWFNQNSFRSKIKQKSLLISPYEAPKQQKSSPLKIP